jgi:hypothetical protein
MYCIQKVNYAKKFVAIKSPPKLFISELIFLSVHFPPVELSENESLPTAA